LCDTSDIFHHVSPLLLQITRFGVDYGIKVFLKEENRSSTGRYCRSDYLNFEFLDCGAKYLSLLINLLSIHSYFDRAVLNSLLTLPEVRGPHRFAEAVING